MVRFFKSRKAYSLSALAFCLILAFPTSANDLYNQDEKPLKNIYLGQGGTMTVLEIFQLIEQNSELSFAYHKADINSSLEVEINLKNDNPSAYDALKEISKKEKLKFRRIDDTINVIIPSSELEGEEKLEKADYTVAGKILDETSQPLIGATVLIKGTGNGTVTDIDGNFNLNVPEGEHTLVITYVGYKTRELAIDESETDIKIIMEEDVEALQEVVVVGYAKQKKESITGSVAKIESKEIAQTKTANIANSLSGRVPGLVINARGGEPGRESMEIFIRGKATTGDASPLFVIDGVANRGSFERLNPDDIESISILKDASAAIYGAQAANGVILITTKRGSEGSPQFSYSNTFSLTQPAKRQNLMNAPQYLTWVDEQNSRNFRPQIYQNVIEDYLIGENDPNVWPDTDWWSEAMDEWSPQYQHNMSISGGSKNFKYFVSGQHLYQDANFKGREFGFRQSNIRSNVDINATSFLDIGLDLAGRLENTKGSGGVEGLIRGIYNMAPFESPYYQNGLLRNTSKGNILPSINGLNGGSETDRLVFNSKVSTTISLEEWVEGLSLVSFAAFDIINQGRKVLQSPYDIYFLNSEGEYENLREDTGDTRLFQQLDQEFSTTLHSRIKYEGQTGKHSYGGFVAYEQNKVNGEYIAGSRVGLISEDLPFLFTGSQENQLNDGRGWQSARVNYFGRLNYSYDDRYLLEFTMRRDGSQNFARDRRFGTFPGVSAGWRISEELFWTSNFLEDVKLRASWGRLGNDRVANFQYLSIYNIETAAVFGENPAPTNGLTPGRTTNPYITWETSDKTNIGLDLSFSEGILDFSFDAFYEERSNILAQRNASVPVYSGIVLPDENIGKTKNQGFEISTIYRNLISSNLEYRISGQFTYARNEIIFVDESPFVPEYQKVEGSPIDYLLVYQSKGLYQNQEQIDASPHFPDAKPGDVIFDDINNDNVIDGDDRILLPYGPTPRMVFGISGGLTYRGFDMNIFFQGQAGASTIYRPWDLNQDAWYFENRWISEEETPNALSPAAWDMSSSSIQNVSTIWVRKNHFLRIKNIELSYSFPQNLIDTYNLTNLRVFVSAFNLGFVYNSVGLYDPESRSDTGWYYPQQRLVSTGLNLTF